MSIRFTSWRPEEMMGKVRGFQLHLIESGTSICNRIGS
jgi:hypothetical protein